MENISLRELEYIHFRYQRLTKLVEMVNIAIKNGEYSQNAAEWALYEIENCLEENNKVFEKLIIGDNEEVNK